MVRGSYSSMGKSASSSRDDFLEKVIFDKKNCCNFLYSEWILDILVLILVISLVSLEHMTEKGGRGPLPITHLFL